jgi:hypothetical protein
LIILMPIRVTFFFRYLSCSFPSSIFFIALRADLVALEQRDPATARAIVATGTEHVGDLCAFEWVLNYKQALLCLAQLQFDEAAELFVASLQVYVRVGRRSMVPFMAMYAVQASLVASLVAGGEASQTRAVEMLLLVRKYRALPKKNWGRQDKWAFKVYSEGGYGRVIGDDCADDGADDAVGDAAGDPEGKAGEGKEEAKKVLTGKAKKSPRFRKRSKSKASKAEAEEEGDTTPDTAEGVETNLNFASLGIWPALDCIESMALRMRCTCWVPHATAEKLVEMLDSAPRHRREAIPIPTVAQQARVAMVRAQILHHQPPNRWQEALDYCDEAIALEPDLVAEDMAIADRAQQAETDGADDEYERNEYDEVERNEYEGLKYGAVPMSYCLKGLILTTVVDDEGGNDEEGAKGRAKEGAKKGAKGEGSNGKAVAVVGGRASDLPRAQEAYKLMTAYGKKRR